MMKMIIIIIICLFLFSYQHLRLFSWQDQRKQTVVTVVMRKKIANSHQYNII